MNFFLTLNIKKVLDIQKPTYYSYILFLFLQSWGSRIPLNLKIIFFDIAP